MWYIFFIILYGILFHDTALLSVTPDSFHPKPIVVIIPSYNNINWYKRNLDTLIAQEKNYTYWFAIYVDDCSTDGTGEAVEQYVQEKGFAHKIIVVKNKVRQGALANIYTMVHRCKDNMIMVMYDGDDFFAHDKVLYRINMAYQNPDVWLTYGQYEHYPNKLLGQCEMLPQEIIKNNSYREYKWVTSHVRTFYAGLFKEIRKEDLMFKNEFYPMAWDLAMIFPMLEMAAGRICFIEDVMYLYNCINPLNDFRVSATRQEIYARHIRALKPYSKIDHLRS